MCVCVCVFVCNLVLNERLFPTKVGNYWLVKLHVYYFINEYYYFPVMKTLYWCPAITKIIDNNINYWVNQCDSWMFCVTFVFPYKASDKSVAHSAGVSPWKEMFRGFSICHIKAETAIGAVPPPVPNFPSPQHTVVPPFVGKPASVFPVHCEL